jgi:peptidyl-tRNA hydrolase
VAEAGDGAQVQVVGARPAFSGEAVAAILRRSPAVAEDVLVVLDDADLPLGRLRIRVAGSSGGHRGLASITASLRWFRRSDRPR